MRAAYFSDFINSTECETAWIHRIRQITGADEVVVVMCGDFMQNGFPAQTSAACRVQRGLSAGADGVIRMSDLASLSSPGIYAYSAARLIDKLKSVDVLILETESPETLLSKIIYLSIANPRSYQNRVTAYKNSGMPFNEASARAIGEELGDPDAETAMRSNYNIFAVECAKALKIMYSSIKYVFVPKEGMICLEDSEEPDKSVEPAGLSKSDDSEKLSDLTSLDRLLEYQLVVREEELSDIYGGYEQLTERILAHRDDFDTFESFSKLLAGTDKGILDVRQYLLRLLCGIRKSAVTVWRMYDFSPWCMLYSASETLAAKLRDVSHVRIITSDEDIFFHEPSKRELLALEKRMESIYTLIK